MTSSWLIEIYHKMKRKIKKNNKKKLKKYFIGGRWGSSFSTPISHNQLHAEGVVFVFLFFLD